MPGLFFDLVFFATFFFSVTRCCGGDFATTPAARSKRSHASGCNSNSILGLCLAMDKRTASAILTTYCGLMEIIKGRTNLIVSLTKKPPVGVPPFFVYELQHLQVRMVCEILAKACLVLHGDIAGAKSAKLTDAYQADHIMKALEKLHPHFFPRPVKPGPDRPNAWGEHKPMIAINGEQAPKQQVIVLMTAAPKGQTEAKLFEVIPLRFAPKGSESQS